MIDTELTGKRREILDFIAAQLRERGYPPSVREIGEAVGLTSSSTVHTHLTTLQRQGYLRRDPTKPRAIEVRYDTNSGIAIDRRPARHVPLVGEVAAGVDVLAEENIEELLPLPEDFTGDGQLFMLKVRGDSMIEAGILDGDYVVVRHQNEAEKGDVVVAGIPGGEATVKTYSRRGGQGGAHARQLHHGTDDLQPRRGGPLRQGGHRPASAVAAGRRGATQPPTGLRLRPWPTRQAGADSSSCRIAIGPARCPLVPAARRRCGPAPGRRDRS